MGPAPAPITWRKTILTGHGPTGALGTHIAGTTPAGAAGTDGEALLALILAALDEDSAEEIVHIPLAGKSEEADHMVIASGRSTRHVSALSEKLSERLKPRLGATPPMEGRETADWVLIDAGDVIVHIFRPEVREFYQLEKMWMAEADRAARTA